MSDTWHFLASISEELLAVLRPPTLFATVESLCAHSMADQTVDATVPLKLPLELIRAVSGCISHYGPLTSQLMTRRVRLVSIIQAHDSSLSGVFSVIQFSR